MNIEEKEFDKLYEQVEEIRKEDPLKAIYLIDEAKKNFVTRNELADIESLRENIVFQIKKNKLITKTNLDTLTMINSLKNKKMDYVFMLIYNELKNREDLKQYASEFQYFFNSEGFDNAGFQTLVYDLLYNAKIDYDYKVQNEIINPVKLGSFLENKEILKMQDEIFATFNKDVAKNKIARQVFSAYLFQNWVDILLKKTQNDYIQIVDVVGVLYGEKNVDELDESEKKLYAIFR
ncbi:hypothetical protein [Metamycoplasma neophronis]|uniref:DUF3196 domain-containing protein n=1 Tax=Metamycoplasma neophronis TaxID=872983 RepID=A0ABY2Z4I4_9BACT|nr:hypothetical protein [Metamycoplasma neophronis]TPR53360.1 hypothetical protein FJR74_02785 [Metamycoplasma neophronis]